MKVGRAPSPALWRPKGGPPYIFNRGIIDGC